MTRIAGLPGVLPPGEHLVWQGAPCWRSLARRMCHVRGVAAYVGVVASGLAGVTLLEGGTVLEAALTTAPLLGAGAAVLLFLCGLAWLVAHTTEYSLTTHRVVMRFGIALPATLAIPHGGIARVAVAVHPDGTGDLAVTLKPGFRVPYHRLWPHARPWRLTSAEPMLRSVRAAGQVAMLMSRTLGECGDVSAAVADKQHPALVEAGCCLMPFPARLCRAGSSA